MRIDSPQSFQSNSDDKAMKIRETAAPNDRPPKKIKTQNQDLNSSDLRRKMLINQVRTCMLSNPYLY